jgi:hypothetical protein
VLGTHERFDSGKTVQMEAWTVGLLLGVVILIVLFVVWGPDISSRRGGDDGQDRPQGPYSGSGDGIGGGNGGAGM